MNDDNVGPRHRRVMENIDDEGAPPLSKEGWIDLLERTIEDCKMRLEAAREELRREQRRK